MKLLESFPHDSCWAAWQQHGFKKKVQERIWLKFPTSDLMEIYRNPWTSPIYLQRRSRIAFNQTLETWVGSLENCLHFQTEYWVIFAHHLQGITVFVFPTTIGMLRNEQGNIMEYPDMGRINKRSLFAQLQAFGWRRPFGWAARIEGFKRFFWNHHWIYHFLKANGNIGGGKTV